MYMYLWYEHIHNYIHTVCTCMYMYTIQFIADLIFGLEGFNLLKELVCQVFDFLIVVHVLQPQLVLILHLEFIHTCLQL